MSRIFISYSRNDALFIKQFVPFLKESFPNHDFFYDDEISGGEDWLQRILREVDQCDLFLYLLSNDALVSSYCQSEFREALRLRKPYLPVIIRPKTDIGNAQPDLNVELSRIQWIDLSKGFQDSHDIAPLFAAISLMLAQTSQTLPSRFDDQSSDSTDTIKKLSLDIMVRDLKLTPDQQSANVFISYSRIDGREFSDQLYRHFQFYSVDVWRDERNLDKYQDYSVMIERAIRRATHVVVCLTPSVVDRPDSFVRREIIYAQNQGKPVIPLRYDGISPKDIPILISHLIWIEFTSFENGFKELIQRIGEHNEQYVAPVLPQDPFRDYLLKLNQQLIKDLEETVFNTQVLSLATAEKPDAVEERTIPQAYKEVKQAYRPVKRVRPFLKDDVVPEFKGFSDAFANYGGRVLLLGEPGSGKTTTLLSFARDKTNERLADSTALLPIYVSIRHWTGETNFFQWLGNETILDAKHVEQEVEAGRALLLLDGLDELSGDIGGNETRKSSSADNRVEFLRLISDAISTPVVVSCRMDDYDEIIAKAGQKIPLHGAVVLQPLSDDQIKVYLEQQPALWTALLADDNLRNMVRTPLLLLLLTVAYRGADDKLRELQQWSDSPAKLRNEIFKRYVQTRYEFEQAHYTTNLPFTLDELYDICGRATFETLSNVRSDYTEIREIVFSDLLPNQANSFLEFAQKLHLLLPPVHGRYRFIHLLLRDHFAANYALECLAKSDLDARRNAVRVLGTIKEKLAVDILIDLLKDNEFIIRAYAARALGKIGDRKAVSPLIQVLKSDSDARVRAYAIKALGRLGGEEAQEAAITALQHDEELMLEGMRVTLGQRNSKAAQPLMNALKQRSEFDKLARTIARVTLGLEGADINMISTSLNDVDKNIRMLAAWALVYIDNINLYPDLIEKLIKMLNDPDSDVRVIAAIAFGRLELEGGVLPLINALQDPHPDVQYSVINALGEIGDVRAIQPLLDKEKGADNTLQEVIHEALVKIGYVY
jgi:HEAT repeat protein